MIIADITATSCTGQILDAKDRRDREKRRHVTASTKIVASVGLFLLASWLLVYIYLFALRQTESRQSAWFQSFVVWLLFEIFIVSSLLVFVQQIFIPMLTMKDVQRVKRRVVDDILSFKNKAKTRAASVFAGRRGSSQRKESMQAKGKLNAAKYFYASYRIAKIYPDVKESAMVASFSTPYPKRSLIRQDKDMSKVYGRKFRFIGQSFSRVGLYLLVQLVQLPPPVQDAITQVVLSSGFGYAIVFLVKLYEVSPLLVLFPITLMVIIVYSITFGGSRSELRNAPAPQENSQAATSPAPTESDGARKVVPISHAITTADTYGNGHANQGELIADIRKSIASIHPTALTPIDEDSKRYPDTIEGALLAVADAEKQVEGAPQTEMLRELRNSLNRVHPLTRPAVGATGDTASTASPSKSVQPSIPPRSAPPGHTAHGTAAPVTPARSREGVVSVVEMLKSTSSQRQRSRRRRPRDKLAKQSRHHRGVGVSNADLLDDSHHVYYTGDTSSDGNCSAKEDNRKKRSRSASRNRSKCKRHVAEDSRGGYMGRTTVLARRERQGAADIPSPRQEIGTGLQSRAGVDLSRPHAVDRGTTLPEMDEEAREWRVRWERLSEEMDTMQQESVKQIEELEGRFLQLQEQLNRQRRTKAAPSTAKPFAEELLQSAVSKRARERAEEMRQEREATQLRIQYAERYTHTLLTKQVNRFAGTDHLHVPLRTESCDRWDHAEWKSQYQSFARGVEEEYQSAQRVIRELQKRCQLLESEVAIRRQSQSESAPQHSPANEVAGRELAGTATGSSAEAPTSGEVRDTNGAEVSNESTDISVSCHGGISGLIITRVPFTGTADDELSYEGPPVQALGKDLAYEFDAADIEVWPIANPPAASLDAADDPKSSPAPQWTTPAELSDADTVDALSSWTVSLDSRRVDGTGGGTGGLVGNEGAMGSDGAGSGLVMGGIATSVPPWFLGCEDGDCESGRGSGEEEGEGDAAIVSLTAGMQAVAAWTEDIQKLLNVGEEPLGSGPSIARNMIVPPHEERVGVVGQDPAGRNFSLGWVSGEDSLHLAYSPLSRGRACRADTDAVHPPSLSRRPATASLLPIAPQQADARSAPSAVVCEDGTYIDRTREPSGPVPFPSPQGEGEDGEGGLSLGPDSTASTKAVDMEEVHPSMDLLQSLHNEHDDGRGVPGSIGGGSSLVVAAALSPPSPSPSDDPSSPPDTPPPARPASPPCVAHALPSALISRGRGGAGHGRVTPSPPDPDLLRGQFATDTSDGGRGGGRVSREQRRGSNRKAMLSGDTLEGMIDDIYSLMLTDTF